LVRGAILWLQLLPRMYVQLSLAWARRLWWFGALVWQCRAWQYGIVVDAGTGGSRLHAFRWAERVADPLHPHNAAITIPEGMFQVQVKPGISAFTEDVSGLYPYLDRLMSLAKEKLHHLRELWPLIPIYFKATAGARDLFQDERDRIFAVIREYLYACPFRFETDYWARTISGEEEGVYAWLSVNLLSGTFRSSRKSDTWGSMDMGGASTQVAFLPHDVSIVQNFFPLHLSYLSIHLYAHSYLEFGYNDANQRILRQFLWSGASGTEDNPLAHPCFPAGRQFRQPLREPFFVGRSSISVVGTGDVPRCMELATKLLDLNKPCFVPAKSRDFANDSWASGACAISGTYEPALHTAKFVAMGQFSKIARSMGLPLDARSPLSAWFQGTQRLCAAEPSTLKFDAAVDDPESLAASPVPTGWIPDPMASELSRCWKAIWFWTVLHKGFHFPLDTEQIWFAGTLEGQHTAWALGSMAYDANYYPWGGRLELGSLEASAELARGAWPSAWVPAAGPVLGVALGLAVGLAAGLALSTCILSSRWRTAGPRLEAAAGLESTHRSGGHWRWRLKAEGEYRLLGC